MKNYLGKNVRLQRVSLHSISAVRNEIKSPEVTVHVELDPKVIDENEDMVILLCKIDVGGEEQPFTIHLETKAAFRKLRPTTGNEIIENFSSISYPILSESSMLIAQVVSAMNYPPLIISPIELMESFVEAQEKN